MAFNGYRLVKEGSDYSLKFEKAAFRMVVEGEGKEGLPFRKLVEMARREVPVLVEDGGGRRDLGFTYYDLLYSHLGEGDQKRVQNDPSHYLYGVREKPRSQRFQKAASSISGNITETLKTLDVTGIPWKKIGIGLGCILVVAASGYIGWRYIFPERLDRDSVAYFAEKARLVREKSPGLRSDFIAGFKRMLSRKGYVDVALDTDGGLNPSAKVMEAQGDESGSIRREIGELNDFLIDWKRSGN